MKQQVLQSVVWKEGAHYVAQCLNLDISGFGDSREEALENLDEAISLYFEDTDDGNVTEVQDPELIPLTVKYA